MFCHRGNNRGIHGLPLHDRVHLPTCLPTYLPTLAANRHSTWMVGFATRNKGLTGEQGTVIEP